MIKIFNKIFNISKLILLTLSLAFTLYIMLFMYEKLDKSYFGHNFLDFFGTIFPLIVLLILFTINYALHQEYINNNILYNSCCMVSLISIIMIGYRTLYDTNMIYWAKDGFNINFSYFNDQISQIKLLAVLLCFTNILIIIKNVLFDKNKEINKLG